MHRVSPPLCVERRAERECSTACHGQQANGDEHEGDEHLDDAQATPATFRMVCSHDDMVCAARKSPSPESCGEKQTAAMQEHRGRLVLRSGGYLQAGSPSPAVVTTGFAVLTPMPQENDAICVCVIVADQ
jgi:hypothetical protein